MSIGSMGLGLGITRGGASAGDEGGGAPEWVPEGAVQYADFVNGHYWLDGAEVTLADIINLDGIVAAARGLDLSSDAQENNPVLTAAALSVASSLAATGLTQITKWDIEFGNNGCELNGPALSAELDIGTATHAILGIDRDGASLGFNSYDEGTILSVSPPWLVDGSAFIKKVGVTLYRPDGLGGFDCEIASDGTSGTATATLSFEGNAGLPLAIYAPFGHWSGLGRTTGWGNQLFMAEWIIYPALSLVQLQALTA